MSNLLNIKDQSGNWIPIPVVTNGIKSITQNQDYTLTITLNDGTTYTTTSIKGEDGQDYVLTEQDKQDIARLVDTPVDDVQINGTSIVENGVANVPIADGNTAGAVKINPYYGIGIYNGQLMLNAAQISDIKIANTSTKAVSTVFQHASTFYGLAKASGDTTQSQSDNEVGVYTNEAKASIKNMLGVEDVDIDSKAPVITETASGDIVSFDDGADDMPLQSLVVDINPVQDLHGYDSPWPAGGRKNILPTMTNETESRNGVTFTRNANGSISMSGTITEAAPIVFVEFTLSAGNYTFSNIGSNASSANTYAVFYVRNLDAQETLAYINYNTPADNRNFTLTETTNVRFYTVVQAGATISGTVYPMIRLSSVTDATYAPYSNICPIIGWTGCEVQRTGVNVWDEEWEIGTINVSTGELASAGDRIRSKNLIPCLPSTPYYVIDPTSGNNVRLFFYANDGSFISAGNWTGNAVQTTPVKARFLRFIMAASYGTTYKNDISINYPSTDHDYHPYTGRTYPITFPTEAGTVYGGYIDPINGEMVVDRAQIASYNGETLPSTWISDRDVYASGTTPTIGAQVVYELAEPIHYPLTATEIKTLLGQNNIWANTGNSEVTYRADSELYINKQIPDVPVEDVQINGTSILTDGVANIPVGGNDLGVVKENLAYGIDITGQGQLLLITPSDIELKKGYAGTRRAIMTLNQHIAAFYGLAKAAGADEKDSTLPVGQYTDSAKTAIKNMLGVIDGGGTISETITGTDPTITAQNNFRYMCGELYTLNFTPCVSGVCEVIFTSGATPTVLTLPDTVRMPAWWTGVEANTTYEISIVDGVYGAVMSWS